MKIALLTDGISPIVTGGMQKHSFYLAKYLAKNKVFVDLYHCVKKHEKHNLKDLFDDDELAFINEKVFVFPTQKILPFHYIRNSYNYSIDLLKAYLSEEEADFIYAQGFTAWAFFADKKKGSIKAPIGVNFHGLEMFQLAEGWKSKMTQYVFRGPVKYNLRSSDYAYSLGGKLTDILREFCTASQIREISIGLDAGWIRNSDIKGRVEEGRTKLVFIGRYERRKGIEELNHVIEKLDGSAFSIDFIGPIPEDKKLSKSYLMYHGLIKEEAKLKKILDKADILICPSLAEGMPTVILEAMARGMAIIATDVGAVQVEVDEKNGWVVPAGNKEQLEDAVKQAMMLPDEDLLSMKKQSLHKIQNEFLWSKVMDKTLQHIQLSLNPS